MPPEPEVCKLGHPLENGRGRWFILHDSLRFISVHGTTTGQYPDGPYCASCVKLELARRNQPSPWVPADPDGLPPSTYPAWRKQEQLLRQEREKHSSQT